MSWQLFGTVWIRSYHCGRISHRDSGTTRNILLLTERKRRKPPPNEGRPLKCARIDRNQVHFVFGLSCPCPARTSLLSTDRTSSLSTSTFTSSWLTTVEPCGTTTAPSSGTVIPTLASPVRLFASACSPFMVSLVFPSARV